MIYIVVLRCCKLAEVHLILLMGDKHREGKWFRETELEIEAGKILNVHCRCQTENNTDIIYFMETH